MDLSIIIVSYNTKALLTACLETLLLSAKSASGLRWEIIVIDNASADGSPAMVQRQFPEVILLQQANNLGFGRANNVGAAQAQGHYLLLINSDTKVPKNFINQFWHQALQTKAQLSSCRLLYPDGRLQPQGGALPNLFNLFFWQFFLDDLPLIQVYFPAYQRRSLSYFQADQTPGWVSATALLIQRQLFDRLNGFNPAIFLYGEDVDLCYRARQLSVPVYYFTTPSLTHFAHQSGSAVQAIIGEYRYLKYFFIQYRSPWQWPLAKVILKSGARLRQGLFGKILKQYAKADAYRQAYRLV